MNKLDDKDIRAVLRKMVSAYKNARVFDEYTTYSGKSRADLVAINGHVNAFEIKSDYDSLNRLENQVREYDLNFERNCIVAGEKYIEEVSKIVPDHWGIIMARRNRENKVSLNYKRVAKLNPNLDFVSFTGLLESSKLRKIILDNNFYAKVGLNRDAVNGMFKYDLIAYLDSKLSRYQKSTLKGVIRAKLKEE
ncbi:sce7726 family protein [Levilactobacillus brevis]|uniref:sce7726 family protein n=1 Tax=Levilactobacillus brevis TaxID=1580 RepID=UPI0004B768DB|nr:sce7726 family protein [Levilactobacillus brevis]MCT2886869.1 hypothetical protein [Levilactobacillus brevis]MCT3575639.1 hypothetical protein [Levilactobacillus brevis]MCZ2120144.1 sce7726 family protein [Levilactobacillus brevis]MCZ2125636.1 sce7726 family protein [Levilactobacillus brevis]MCZ2209952.1 sce7726 family protein [Levilactobacillus brevis]